MANLNRIILIGRLTQDPEVKFTVDGSAMARFTLVVSRFAGQADKDATDFIDVIAWGKLAEACGEMLKKDSLCLIEGRIQVRQFEVEPGKRRYATEVVARSMQMLEPKKSADSSTATQAVASDDEIFESAGDLPF
ncbi:MAG: single-stranded DNA-binding protein [Candidatus Margulisbacteria bacterium]|nr:single-stranded DNA-binding protein [Candidatus Margulisiibacteriota bacterium]MBU1021948.1 single-stranded DNA-binding protein [Candidatus Margulisiibacteriota bacterium]MBU1728927.1 single-stranded DNA-binding protein [Candidatus Margulisiibacteriota bacterium]MBU1954733.1 single-stranded DNA-binding protein [Candidatus Margulisiibacteriota bacterium]